MSDLNTTPLPVIDPAQEPSDLPQKKKKKKLLTIIGVIVVLALAIAGVAYAILANTYNKIDRVAFHDRSYTRPAPVKTGATNILLLGSDSRDTTDPDLDGSEMTGFRSDAIMVAQISPDKQHVTIMSIMRDNWVAIEGYGEAKINAAFAFGGIPLAVNTVENFIGTRIDHGAIVDFQSFKGLTDALGGITIKNEIPFQASHDPEYYFGEGEITLNGDEALMFVRERYAFSDGDYQRVRNQQTYMMGLAGKLLSRETLLNPVKLTNTFEELEPFLVVDQDLTLPKVLGLGASASGLRIDDFKFFTSPTHGTGWSPDGQSIIVPDEEEMAKVQEHFKNGTLHEYEPLPDL